MTGDLSNWDILFNLNLNATQAIATLSFFHPQFIERDGCVLLRETLNDLDYQEISKNAKGDKHAIETAVNCVDFTDIFDFNLPSDGFRSFVAEVAELWRWSLNQYFPGRSFNIDVVDFSGEGSWGIELSEARKE